MKISSGSSKREHFPPVVPIDRIVLSLSILFFSIPHRPVGHQQTTTSRQQRSSSSQIWSKAQSSDSLNNCEASAPPAHYSENLRNSSYFMSSGPQSMLMYPSQQSYQQQPLVPQPQGTSSGASSLPYISRSLSIDAYQQQMMINEKPINTTGNNKNTELEEYAKRYEAIGKRRGSSRHQQKSLWQRNQNSIEEFNSISRCESVISNSSNETLRYAESNSFDSNETLIQPPLEFVDLKKFPLQTTYANSSMKTEATELIDHAENFGYLDPDKRLRVSDNTLKLIQKQALLDYYQRHSKTSTGSGVVKMENSDSGFYSPTEEGGSSNVSPPCSSSRLLEDHSAVINGTDHPDQSSTDLNGLEVS